MSNADALEKALRAVDASLSVLVVARDALLDAIDHVEAPQTPAGTFSGEAPAGPCQHPTNALEDAGVGTGAMICAQCGEQVT